MFAEFHSMIFTQDCNYEKILLTINPTILPEAVQEVITKLPVLIQNSSDLDTSNILKKLKKYTSFPDKHTPCNLTKPTKLGKTKARRMRGRR